MYKDLCTYFFWTFAELYVVMSISWLVGKKESYCLLIKTRVVLPKQSHSLLWNFYLQGFYHNQPSLLKLVWKQNDLARNLCSYVRLSQT